jgi:hypothetical protein
MIYDPQMTLDDASDLYFSLNGFGPDGGYQDRWIKVKVWHIPIWLPNTEGRRRAVKLHDLHHVLTEYPTTWRGDAEISAWEIGSGGLRRYYAGWLLDLMNIAQGLVVNSTGVYRGFMHGRRTSNLYDLEFDDELLRGRVGDFRERLGLDQRSESYPGFIDHVAFVFWVLASAFTYIGVVMLALLPLVLIALWILWR